MSKISKELDSFVQEAFKHLRSVDLGPTEHVLGIFSRFYEPLMGEHSFSVEPNGALRLVSGIMSGQVTRKMATPEHRGAYFTALVERLLQYSLLIEGNRKISPLYNTPTLELPQAEEFARDAFTTSFWEEAARASYRAQTEPIDGFGCPEVDWGTHPT